MEADCGPVAVTASQSGNFPALAPAAMVGETIACQCSRSAVRAMEPLRPTSQQTVSETAAPASQSWEDGLSCKTQVFPPSLDRSMIPLFPARQRIEPDGDFREAEYFCIGRKTAKGCALRGLDCSPCEGSCCCRPPAIPPIEPCRVACCLSR